MDAKYLCDGWDETPGCGHTWSCDPLLNPGRCPACGSIYFKWTNYDAWRREADKKQAG